MTQQRTHSDAGITQDDVAPLASVLFTEELQRRPSRPPDYRGENRALAALAQALADSPEMILQTLADTILEAFGVGSAGISLINEDQTRFHWPAIAGVWKSHVGGGTPRDFGPCGDVFDCNAPLLFKHVERRYTYFQPVTPRVEECLLVPFYVQGKAVGTVWALTHDPAVRKFDNEDLRLLTSLGQFASSAYWTVESLRGLERQGEALRGSEQRLNELIERCPFGIYIVDSSFRIAHMNANSKQGAFANVRPVIGRPFDQAIRILWPEDVAVDVIKNFRHTLDTGEPYYSQDFINLRADKEQVEGYEWELHRITMPDNTFGVTCYYYDATKLRDTEQALRQSEAWLAGQKEALQMAVNGEPLEVSLGMLARLAREQMGDGAQAGLYLADGAGKELHHVVGMPDAYAEFVDGFRIGPDSLACGLAVFNGEPVITADVAAEPCWEPWRWLAEKYDYRACWSFPIQTLAGQVVGTFALYLRQPRAATPRDHSFATLLTRAAAIIITRHEATVERARAEAALREADRRKDEFLAMLAHELRNPLAAIKNAGEILLRTDGDERGVKSAAEILNRQVGHMVRQVDDLLDVSRISRGKIELLKERTELASVVNQAVEAIRPLCDHLDHELTVTLPPNPMYVHGDPVRLAQVVGNLLNNACKFTDRRGRIWLTVEHEGAHAVIRVRDAGIGIAAADLPRIFEMFAQIDRSVERVRDGLGLGLSLVKNLVEMHDGAVEVKSAGLGHGSEFVVRLPTLAEGPKSPLQPTVSEPTLKKGRRILVVDDNRDSATSLVMLLKLTGHATQAAYDGLEAIEAAATFRPEVVLLDIGLPKLNGYEVARGIREEPWGQDMVLFALTGWGQDEDRQKSKEAGFNGHMVKPVELATLTKLLAESDAANLNRALGTIKPWHELRLP